MKTPRQRAEALLETHEGTCLVRSTSDLASEFEKMEQEKLVTIKREVGLFGTKYLNIEIAGYL